MQWKVNFSFQSVNFRAALECLFRENVHLWGKRNPGKLNRESPLHCVCFVYFTAHLIMPAVNICRMLPVRCSWLHDTMNEGDHLWGPSSVLCCGYFFHALKTNSLQQPTVWHLICPLTTTPTDMYTCSEVTLYMKHPQLNMHTYTPNSQTITTHTHTHTHHHHHHHHPQKSFLKRAAVICKSNN